MLSEPESVLLICDGVPSRNSGSYTTTIEQEPVVRSMEELTAKMFNSFREIMAVQMKIGNERLSKEQRKKSAEGRKGKRQIQEIEGEKGRSKSFDRLQRELGLRDETLRQARIRNRVIDTIQMYKKGSEVEILIESLEEELLRAEVQRNKWKNILLPNLSHVY